MMPLIHELPENLDDVTFHAETDLVDGDVVDLGEVINDETMLLESQAKITGEAHVTGLAFWISKVTDNSVIEDKWMDLIGSNVAATVHLVIMLLPSHK